MSLVHVVDDDPTIRTFLKKLLTGKGFEVRVHESAESLLESAADGNRGVVLLDVHMPGGLSGLQLLATRRDALSNSHYQVLPITY